MSGTTTYQKTLIKYQERFFEAVQLGRVTRYAREFAFDAGAFRAFDLGKKTKFNDSVKRELSELGLNVEHAKYLNKFNSMDEAYADASGKVLLERAGRKASARDALIPEIGNRRLFSQSNDPVVKFAGSFLSWAQAKSAQTNSLVRKIEDGDARLALTILATLPLYATVRQAQIQMNPNKDYRKEMTQPFESEENFKKFVGDSVMFSGNIPWWVDKIVSNFKYQQNEAIENIYPIVGLIQDFIDGLKKTAGGKPLTGGIEIVEQVLPFAKEITRRESVGEKIGLDSNIYDEALIRDKDIIPRGTYSTGGLVKGKDDVPQTKENPADRVDPNTGKPYSDQMARLGFNEGGNVNKPKYEYNNMGNIEARYDDWAGRTDDIYFKEGREEGYGGFDSRIAGIRAPLRDFNTKLDRYKNTKDPVAHAVLEYLGGGREGTIEEKMIIAKKENANPEQYIADIKYLRNKKGSDRGIVEAIAMNEQTPEGLKYFLESEEDINTAIELSKHDFDKGTTTEEMLEKLSKILFVKNTK